MAEEPVSFGISDARRIDRVVGWGERHIVDAREPRKQKQFPRGSCGGQRVMFQVIEFDPDEGIATCVVLMKQCGGTVPLMDEDSIIEVYDPTACYFSGEDAESLPNRRGWADYMESLTMVDPYLPCFWCVSALCCQDVL